MLVPRHRTLEIFYVAITGRPTARFTTNAAKSLLMRLDDLGATNKFVIRDRGSHHFVPRVFDTSSPAPTSA